MTQERASRKKGSHTATVLSNVQAGECFWKLRLRFDGEAARAFAGFKPGQFVQFDPARPKLIIGPALLDSGDIFQAGCVLKNLFPIFCLPTF